MRILKAATRRSSAQLTRTCPVCKGKCHVYDPVSLIMPLTVFVAFFERHDPRGVTRQPCGKCYGRGWVR
jgi:DnaJ-class molecular chaperone